MEKNDKNSKSKTIFLKKLGYLIDEYISKGARGQFFLLFITIGCAILLIGLFAAAFTGETAGSGIWQSFIHLLDPGVVSGDDSSRSGFVFLMVIITLIGMIFTGMLISIINNALETKMTDLRKGRSQIVEEDHTIIIGFNENIYCILEELIESNKNQKNGCGIVVLSDTDKEMMEQQIHENIPDHYNSKIICREGRGLRDDLFSRVSMETARSVIVNERNDFQTIRLLLAVTNYLRTYTTSTNIAAIVHNEHFKDAAEAIIEDFPNARVLYFGDLLSKITAQVCRQPGLSLVLMDFFNYEGVEIYFESGGTIDSANGKRISFPLEGKRFPDILNSTLNATVIGYRRGNAGTTRECTGKRIFIDPIENKDTLLQDGDDLIVISEDDGEVILKQTDPGEDLSSLMVPPSKPSFQHVCLLVLDWNNSLDSTLHYMRNFLSADTEIVIVSDRLYDITTIINDMAPIHVEFHLEPEYFFSVECIKKYLRTRILRMYCWFAVMTLIRIRQTQEQ